MQRCLDLAAQGLGYVATNPMVGAVLVYENKIIGEGYHHVFGEPHAEVEAIQNVPQEKQNLISQATLYVNLEPCYHFGKTPPCADFILQKKIPKVVIGQTDPNPLVAGKGIAKLKENGVEIVHGIMEKECLHLNRRFHTYHTKQRPYIILKWAHTADGNIASINGRRESISDETSQYLTHLWRSQEQAIMIGYRTALLDNPSLTTRLVKGNNPVRIVIDDNNDLPAHLKVFDSSASTFKFTTAKCLTSICIQLEKENFYYQLIQHLYKMQLSSVIVEGGAVLHRHFIQNNLWDEARILISTKQFNTTDGVKAATINKMPGEIHQLNKDKLHIYYNT